MLRKDFMNMGKQGNKSQLYSRSVRNSYDFVFKKCKK